VPLTRRTASAPTVLNSTLSHVTLPPAVLSNFGYGIILLWLDLREAGSQTW
jgi:hypothetical protein